MRKAPPHRLGSDRSHSVCDTFQPQNPPEFRDLVALHAYAVSLEVRRLPDLCYVARDALRRNELCKNFSACLVRKPGDDVAVVTECHDNK